MPAKSDLVWRDDPVTPAVAQGSNGLLPGGAAKVLTVHQDERAARLQRLEGVSPCTPSALESACDMKGVVAGRDTGRRSLRARDRRRLHAAA